MSAPKNDALTQGECRKGNSIRFIYSPAGLIACTARAGGLYNPEPAAADITHNTLFKGNEPVLMEYTPKDGGEHGYYKKCS